MQEAKPTLAMHEEATAASAHSQVSNTLLEVLNSTSDFVCLIDSRQTIVFINGAGRKLLALSEDADISHYCLADVCGEHTQKLLEEEAFPKATRDGQWSGDGAILAADGNEIPVSMVVLAHRSSEGTVEMLSMVSRDISDRMKAHLALQESEERFRLMADSAPVLLWMSGTDKLCNYFNRPWLDFTGRTTEQENGNGWAEGVHPEDYQRCLDIYSHSFDARRPFRMEYRLRNSADEYRWILDTGAPRFNTDGSFAGYIGSCVDIHEQKCVEESLEARVKERTIELSRLNNELAVARDHALEASGLKSAFVANISHELRTPLSGIIGMNELLLDTELTADQQDLGLAVHESAEALLNVVNDILDLSKIEAGKLTVESIEIDPVATIYECAQSLMSTAGRKNLIFTTDLDPNVPRALLGDPTRLRQVLLNLLGNAIKFTEEGSITLRAVVDSVNSNFVSIKFSVVDTGIGMSVEEHKYLFTPFTQADGSTTRRYGGTGLGLAISKRLVELMGGKIGFTSSKGNGSVFWFVVPFGYTTTMRRSFRGSRPDVGELTTTAKHVLVVEDNPAMQVLIGKQLQNLGIEFRLAATANIALDEFSQQRFDLILMDCQLPDIDGFQTTQMMRQLEGKHEHTPIVAITASAMSGDRERCIESGMDDYLSKPYTIYQLRQKLKQWISV